MVNDQLELTRRFWVLGNARQDEEVAIPHRSIAPQPEIIWGPRLPMAGPEFAHHQTKCPSSLCLDTFRVNMCHARLVVVRKFRPSLERVCGSWDAELYSVPRTLADDDVKVLYGISNAGF
jgi:hypothetical protein